MATIYDTAGLFGRVDILPWGETLGLGFSPTVQSLLREPYPNHPSTLRLVAFQDSNAQRDLANLGVDAKALYGVLGHEYFTNDPRAFAAYVEEIARINAAGNTTLKPSPEAIARIFGDVAGDGITPTPFGPVGSITPAPRAPTPPASTGQGASWGKLALVGAALALLLGRR